MLLQRLLDVNLEEKEIIAIDDCSKDRSPYILQQFAERLTIIRHATNQGKGAAIRTGLVCANGDYVVIQDADNELDPNDILRLIDLVLCGKARVVYGARDLSVQSWGNRLGNSVLTLATNLLFGTHISDMETCYKLIPTAVMRELDLRANSFDIEPEITAKLARAGFSIAEVPISYRPRMADKKMRPLREGWRALLFLIRFRFGI
jgi:dolichol-phosphate mannosyltransferase